MSSPGAIRIPISGTTASIFVVGVLALVALILSSVALAKLDKRDRWSGGKWGTKTAAAATADGDDGGISVYTLLRNFSSLAHRIPTIDMENIDAVAFSKAKEVGMFFQKRTSNGWLNKKINPSFLNPNSLFVPAAAGDVFRVKLGGMWIDAMSITQDRPLYPPAIRIAGGTLLIQSANASSSMRVAAIMTNGSAAGQELLQRLGNTRLYYLRARDTSARELVFQQQLVQRFTDRDVVPPVAISITPAAAPSMVHVTYGSTKLRLDYEQWASAPNAPPTASSLWEVLRSKVGADSMVVEIERMKRGDDDTALSMTVWLDGDHTRLAWGMLTL